MIAGDHGFVHCGRIVEQSWRMLRHGAEGGQGPAPRSLCRSGEPDVDRCGDPSLAGRESELVKAVFKTFGKNGIKLEEPKNRKGEPEESNYLIFLRACLRRVGVSA
ncbi:hypothetical protein [Pseudonocardia sp. HH130630-07]|uniref:hypothetical protein n=1 Tax=Pseudonocardia sp. HH130630-07 TaxID=1690815 RepID=UPI0012EA1ECA|nr:hypothetical protein [Pseudonocardia sp. HH130630-07]